MIEFKPAEPQDREWVQKLTFLTGNRSMDYSFGILYLWKDEYGIEIGKKGSFFLGRSNFTGRCGKCAAYLYPLGMGDEKKLVEELIKEVKAQGRKILFYGVDGEKKNRIEALFPGRFVFEENRTTFEYIYEREKMATLGGKKYHSKRNQIQRFQRENPSWEYEPITPDNWPECIAMYREWYQNESLEENPGLIAEHHVLELAAVDFFTLGFAGGLIRVGGRVVAFTFGEALSEDTFILHVEKGDLAYSGSYTMINKEFAERLPAHFTYVNREDDTGDASLRKAKLSYQPEILLPKYHVFLQEEYEDVEPFLDSLTEL